MKRLIYLLLLALSFSASPALFGQSAESNALFARGVTLYEEGRYAEAIPLFVAVDSLDALELGEAHQRHGYGQFWQASCLHHLGRTAEARRLAGPYYALKPIDRRLTVLSDSLMQAAKLLQEQKHYQAALPLMQQAEKEVRRELGGVSLWSVSCSLQQCDVYISLKHEEAISSCIRAILPQADTIYAADPYGKQYVLNICMQQSCCTSDTRLMDEVCQRVWHNYDAMRTEADTFSIQLLGTTCDIYKALGQYDRFDLGMERLLQAKRTFYGTTSVAYFNQRLTHIQLAMDQQRLDVAQALVQSVYPETEALPDSLRRHMQGCVKAYEGILLFHQGDAAKAEKMLRQASRMLNPAIPNGKELIAILISTRLNMKAMRGKMDDELLAEAEAMCRQLALAAPHDDSVIGVMSMLQAAYLSQGRKEDALRIANEIWQHEPSNAQVLKMLMYTFLDNNAFVKARQAGHRWLLSLNETLGKKYVADYIDQNRRDIEQSLTYVNNLRQSNLFAPDTTTYALGLLHQDLLEAKLRLLEHADSLGTPSFLYTLHELAVLATKETADPTYLNALRKEFLPKCETALGKEAPVCRWLQRMDTYLRFEKDSLHWHDAFIKQQWPPEHYFAAAEAWHAHGQPKPTWLPARKQTERPEVPSIDSVPHDVTYEEAMQAYAARITFDREHKRTRVDHEGHILWAYCADAADHRNLVLTQMKQWLPLGNADAMAEVDTEDEVAALLGTAALMGWQQEWKELVALLKGSKHYAPHTTSFQVEGIYQMLDKYREWPAALKSPRAAQRLVLMADSLFHQWQPKKPVEQDMRTFLHMRQALWCKRNAERLSLPKEMMDTVYRHFVQLTEVLAQRPRICVYENMCDFPLHLCEMAYERMDYAQVVRADQVHKQLRQYVFDRQKTKDDHDVLGLLADYVDVPLVVSAIGDLQVYADYYPQPGQSLDTYIEAAYLACQQGLDARYNATYFAQEAEALRRAQAKNMIGNEELSKRLKDMTEKMGKAMLHKADSLAEAVYDLALLTKGYLLRSEQQMLKVLLQSGNRTVEQQCRHYLQLKQRLDNATLPADTAAALQKEAEELWQTLAYKNQTFDDYTRRLAASWHEVQAALEDDELAIEFFDEDLYGTYALLLRKGYDRPVVHRLYWVGEQLRALGDTLCTRYLYYPDVWTRQTDFDGKRPDVWQGVRRVYFAPSGALHQLPIEYMPANPQADTLMCEKYDIYRLSSTREIIGRKALANQKPAAAKAQLYGGMTYEIDSDTWHERATRAAASQHTTAMRDVPHLSRAQVGFYLEPLPGTEQEVQRIDALLDTCGIAHRTCTGLEATEDDLKQLSGTGVTLLHVATHGFVQSQEESDDTQAVTFARNHDTPEDRALSRSGLFMTGAAATFFGDDIPASLDDGVLTAREIAHLDLTSLDLVVLSACETGLGEVQGEGVFGLQRGFKKAGAQSLLMSLWSVDDEATQRLMQVFYDAHYRRHLSKRASLNEAQRQLRTYGGGRFNHPRFWAAFVLLDALD